MKSILFLIILVTFLSCEKNPLDNDFKIYENIEYTVTVKVQTDEGTPLSNAWIEGFAFGSSHDYYADDNGEILIKKIHQISKDDNIPEFIPINSFIYPCDSTNVDRLVKDITLSRGMDYPLFVIECILNYEDTSTINTM